MMPRQIIIGTKTMMNNIFSFPPLSLSFLRRILSWLFLWSLLFPVAIVFLFGLGRILSLHGDRHIVLVFDLLGIVFCVGWLCLLVTLLMNVVLIVLLQMDTDFPLETDEEGE
ncbi:MAG: hypothetical protein ACRCUY_11725 [Thermoguttaceae bacterium]